MLKTIFLVVVAISCYPQLAQSINRIDINVPKDTTPINQDIWGQPLKLYNAEVGHSEEFTLKQFKGKPIILDFWATWCSPCVKSFPKMDSLRRIFGGDLVILPITKESERRVKDFFDGLANEERIGLPMSVIEDEYLGRYFPHATIPHYVWIDINGNVSYITGQNEMTLSNVKRFVDGLSVASIKQKEDNVRKFNFEFPFLAQDNAIKNDLLLTHSVLTSYVDGFHPRYGTQILSNTSKIRLYAHNVSLGKIYQMAYSEMIPELLHKERIRLEVNDPQKFFTDKKGEPYTEWIEQNGFCYECIIDSDIETAFQRMRDDLARYFDYDAKIEKETRPCLVLRKTADSVQLESKGGKPEFSHHAYGMKLINNPWYVLPNQLSMYYLQLDEPLIDETGIEGKVDVVLQGKLSSLKSLNDALGNYGLEIVRDQRNVDVIVIRDKIKKH